MDARCQDENGTITRMNYFEYRLRIDMETKYLRRPLINLQTTRKPAFQENIIPRRRDGAGVMGTAVCAMMVCTIREGCVIKKYE